MKEATTPKTSDDFAAADPVQGRVQIDPDSNEQEEIAHRITQTNTATTRAATPLTHKRPD